MADVITERPLDLSEKFAIIRVYFEAKDRERMAHGKAPFHDTSHGIWGASSMLDLYEFFLRCRLERFSGFADYGSGDGRIVLLAALFTTATGIEGDAAMVREADEAKSALVKSLPELTRATFIHGDYYAHDPKPYDMIFMFPDQPYPRTFEQKLKERFSGFLIVYNRIHQPYGLTKGKTYWIQQLPIGSYPLNVGDEDLFAAR